MKKISVKMVIMMLAIFVLMSIITRLFVIVFIDFLPKTDINQPMFLWGFPIIILSTLTIFAFVINKMIVKRMQVLSIATKKVAIGNFEEEIVVKGTDELSILTKNFNDMTKELKANAYLSKKFVSNVSHEIKTPLSSISGFAEMIEEKSTDSEIINYAKIIEQEAQRLSQLSKSMLQLSLLDSTTIIKKEDNFKPSGQIRTIIANLQLQWEEKNIEFDVDLDDTIITSNEQLLYQVWQNLISNAIKFAYENSTIKISLIKEKEQVHFVITNSGIGIKEEDKDKIFTQFFVADKSRNTKGTGLGLSITKAIVQKLDGSIKFESEENNYTRFTVIL